MGSFFTIARTVQTSEGRQAEVRGAEGTNARRAAPRRPKAEASQGPKDRAGRSANGPRFQMGVPRRRRGGVARGGRRPSGGPSLKSPLGRGLGRCGPHLLQRIESARGLLGAVRVLHVVSGQRVRGKACALPLCIVGLILQQKQTLGQRYREKWSLRKVPNVREPKSVRRIHAKSV